MSTPMRVLVVDDAEVARTTLRSILSRAGHEVQLAGCVDEAREALHTWEPDCVVLDHRLPDGDGLALARELRGQPARRPLRIVVMSGDALPAEETAAADVFLLKPAGARDVLSAVAGPHT